MAKTSTGSITRSKAKAAPKEPLEEGIAKARFEAVMQAAARSGLLGGKSGRIGGRVSPELVQRAKRLSGIATDSELIEFALATIALEDGFARAFAETRGTVDPDLKLGY